MQSLDSNYFLRAARRNCRFSSPRNLHLGGFSHPLSLEELLPPPISARWAQKAMSDGFAWNGQTYDSLSKVAFAITGTNWNGPRFFGLRNKEDRLRVGEARP
jgi:hypothetical protein